MTKARVPWLVLGLLAISGFLNYFDRANLSAGATDIQKELGLSGAQLGMLLSAFFWTYALAQLLSFAGWFADRFNVCIVLAAGFLLWSGATAATGIAKTFVVVFGLRLVLGLGESIAYPAYSRIIANTFPEHHRGFANACIDAATKMGPAMGTLLGGLLIADYGWRAFFLVLGAASLLWLVPWLIWMPRGQGVSARENSADVPGILEILSKGPAIATAFGLFCSNYFWYFLLTWLPHYMETERHFPKKKMSYYACAAFFAIALSAMISGRLSDRWIERGASPTRVRKTFAGLGLTLSTIIVSVVLVHDERIAMGLLILTCACFGLYTANVFAITQTLAGPCAAGKWTSLQNGFANLAGVAAPWLTGWIVDQTGQYFLAFALAAVVVLTGAAIFIFGIKRIEPVKWSKA